jgi:hypothetical protein
MRPLKQHGLARLRVTSHSASGGRCQTMQQAQQGTFAAAIGPDQRHMLTGLNMQ